MRHGPLLAALLVTGCPLADPAPDAGDDAALGATPDGGEHDAWTADEHDAAATDDAGRRERNSPGSDALLTLLRAMPRNEMLYDDAVAAGATFTPTSDGDSFVLYWEPPGFDPATSGVVVSLHGHDGFVGAGLDAWEPFLRERGHALIALQWWFGAGETIVDYYTPAEIYPLLLEAMEAHGFTSRRALFEGFSRGGAVSYAVTAMDHTSPSPRFLLTVSAAGSAQLDYPPTAEIASGRYGPMPLAGARWVLYCGQMDREVMDNCARMHETRDFLVDMGASVDLFLEDPTGGHGGFHQNPANCNAALDLYATLL